uniref:Uncharacterized protein n=1 Tax=Glossina austeni TaxID=7395 RepID=A0A1A9UGK0_GLOAU
MAEAKAYNIKYRRPSINAVILWFRSSMAVAGKWLSSDGRMAIIAPAYQCDLKTNWTKMTALDCSAFIGRVDANFPSIHCHEILCWPFASDLIEKNEQCEEITAGPNFAAITYLAAFCTFDHRRVIVIYMVMFQGLGMVYCPAMATLFIHQKWTFDLAFIVHKPWRFLMLLNSLPGLIGIFLLIGVPDSPEIVLCTQGKEKCIKVVNADGLGIWFTNLSNRRIDEDLELYTICANMRRIEEFYSKLDGCQVTLHSFRDSMLLGAIYLIMYNVVVLLLRNISPKIIVVTFQILCFPLFGALSWLTDETATSVIFIIFLAIPNCLIALISGIVIEFTSVDLSKKLIVGLKENTRSTSDKTSTQYIELTFHSSHFNSEPQVTQAAYWSISPIDVICHYPFCIIYLGDYCRHKCDSNDINIMAISIHNIYQEFSNNNSNINVNVGFIVYIVNTKAQPVNSSSSSSSSNNSSSGSI